MPKTGPPRDKVDEYYEVRPSALRCRWERERDRLEARLRAIEQLGRQLGYTPEAERHELDRIFERRVELMHIAHRAWGVYQY